MQISLKYQGKLCENERVRLWTQRRTDKVQFEIKAKRLFVVNRVKQRERAPSHSTMSKMKLQAIRLFFHMYHL